MENQAQRKSLFLISVRPSLLYTPTQAHLHLFYFLSKIRQGCFCNLYKYLFLSLSSLISLVSAVTCGSKIHWEQREPHIFLI